MRIAVSFEIQQVDGDTVITLGRYSDDSLRSLGVDFIEGVEEYVIRDGKITAYTWTMTDESLAKLMAALPPEALPDTGAESFPSYIWIVIAGILTFLSGAAAALLKQRLS